MPNGTGLGSRNLMPSASRPLPGRGLSLGLRHEF
jgi:hypothetical protein